MCHDGEKTNSVSISNITKRILARGFSQNDLDKTLREYEELNIIMISSGKLNFLG